MNENDIKPSGKTRAVRSQSKKFTIEDTIKYLNANFYTKSTVVKMQTFKKLTEDEKSEVQKALPDHPSLSQLNAENVVFTSDIRKAILILLSLRPQLSGKVQLTSDHLISGVFEDFGDYAITLPSMNLTMSDKFRIVNGGFNFLRSQKVQSSISVAITRAINTMYSSWKNKDKHDLYAFVAIFLLKDPPKKSNKISVKGETKIVRKKRIYFHPDYFEDNVDGIQNCWVYDYNSNNFKLYEMSSSTLVEEKDSLKDVTYGCVDSNTILVLNSDSNLDEALIEIVYDITGKYPVALKGFTFGVYAKNSLVILKKCYGIANKILSADKIKALVKTQSLLSMRQYIKQKNLGNNKMTDNAVIRTLENSDNNITMTAKKLADKWLGDYVDNLKKDEPDEEDPEEDPPLEKEDNEIQE